MERIVVHGVVDGKDEIYIGTAFSIDMIINDDDSGEFNLFNDSMKKIAEVYFKNVTHYVWSNLDLIKD